MSSEASSGLEAEQVLGTWYIHEGSVVTDPEIHKKFSLAGYMQIMMLVRNQMLNKYVLLNS